MQKIYGAPSNPKNYSKRKEEIAKESNNTLSMRRGNISNVVLVARSHQLGTALPSRAAVRPLLLGCPLWVGGDHI
jgi:hypothetical protein